METEQQFMERSAWGVFSGVDVRRCRGQGDKMGLERERDNSLGAEPRAYEDL